MSMKDATAWAVEAEARGWDLVIFDPATDFLADAGVDENAGAEVTAWVKAFPELAVRNVLAVLRGNEPLTPVIV